MVEYGLSTEEFYALFRRWARQTGVDVARMDDKTLHGVYAYLQQQAPFRINSNNGNRTLHVSELRQGASTIRAAVQYTRGGEVWSITQDLSNREKRKVLQGRVLESGGAIPPEYRKNVESPAKFLAQYMKKDTLAQVAHLAASILYHRMVERRIAPALASKKADWHPVLTGQDVKESLVKLMLRVERLRRLRVAKDFISLLEPDLVVRIQNIDQTGTRAYNWMNAERAKHAQAYRHQFAALYPMIAPWAIGRSSVHGLAGQNGDVLAERLTKAIDDGGSAQAVLEGFFRQHKKDAGPFLRSAIKFLFGLKQADVPADERANLYLLAADLSHVNPNWYPKSPAQWKALSVCAGAFTEYTANISPEHSRRALFEETKGRWEECAALIGAHGRISDIQDWENAIRHKVIAPRLFSLNLISGTDTSKFFPAEEFYAGLKFFDILAASQRWHAQQREFSGRISGLGAKDAEGIPLNWLPIDDAKKAPNGIDCIPLTSPDQLEVQHRAQAHCVNGYSGSCLYQDSHIISLERDKAVLTTVELREVWDEANKDKKKLPTGVKIQQHQGYARRKPYDDEVEAIDWYVAGLKPDWDKIVAHKDEARKGRDRNEMILKVGFDPLDDQTRRAAFDICRPYFVTSSQRNMDYDTWFERVGLAAKIESAEPVIPYERTPQYRAAVRRFEQARRFG